jgi:hypothetical protein
MKTASAKAKGRLLQQHIVKTILDAFENLEPDDVVSRPMGSPGVDVMLSPKAQRVFPVSIESKNTKVKPGSSALAQAEYNTYARTVGGVAWKPHGKPMKDTLVMLKLDALIDLIKIVRYERFRKEELQDERRVSSLPKESSEALHKDGSQESDETPA